VRLRDARPADIAVLSELALRSKAYWGYDRAFMDACRDELTVRRPDLDRLSFTVAEESARILGFYGLGVDGAPQAELSWLFLDPDAIGTGLGRMLWRHAMDVARELRMVSLMMEADPNAVGFYRAMGAVLSGKAPSGSIPGRSIPVLRAGVLPAQGIGLVLIHSPLVGPSTWEGVALRLLGQGIPVLVPSLAGIELDGGAGAALAARVAGAVPEGCTGVRLVAHSGAGALVPLVVDRLQERPAGAIFVDAGLPARSGSTPLAGSEFLEFLDQKTVDGWLPPWTDWWGAEAMATLIPDAGQRSAVEAECRPIPRAYFDGSFPVPPSWTYVPGSYLLLSPAYKEQADRARKLGWRVAECPGHHLLMVTDPAALTAALLPLVEDALS
jgi:GNAT superfamily N-acetyltransferase